MPAEAAPSLHKMLIPPFWIMAIDATPDRDATLGNREWWAAHDLWLQANKKALKMKVAAWKRREVELAKPWEPKPDEGNDDWDFVCLHAHRGSHEEDSESEDEYGDEESEDGDTQAKDNSAKDKGQEHDEHNHGPVGKLASLHPDHVPVATMRGRDRADWWLLETLKRDPDEFSMHVYNDFAYYGAMEVLEKIFVHFTSVCKPKSHYLDIWCEIEGMALYLHRGGGDFMMCDDPDRGSELISLVGYMTLAALQELERREVLAGNSIPNIGYILSLLISVGWVRGEIAGDDFMDHVSWVYRVMAMAEAAGITIGGASGYVHTAEEVGEREAEGTTAELVKKWEKVIFANKVRSYKTKHGGRLGPWAPAEIGGDYYDVTKMKPAERKQHSYGDHDPFKLR